MNRVKSRWVHFTQGKIALFPIVLIFIFSLFRDQHLLDPTLEYVKVGNQDLTCSKEPVVIDFPFLTQCCQIMSPSGLCRKLVRLKPPGCNLTVLGF